MPTEIIPACEVPLAAQNRIFNEAFAGYLAGFHELDAPGFARFLMAQGADIFYSRFARHGERAGFVRLHHAHG